jgi:hypothetical protein
MKQQCLYEAQEMALTVQEWAQMVEVLHRLRAAPIGLVRWTDPARLRTEAVLSALPTHREPMGVARSTPETLCLRCLSPRHRHRR